MNQPPDSNAREAEQSARELVQLQDQVDAARVVLNRLLQDVIVAESRADAARESKIVEANEQLVLAALRAQVQADEAMHRLEAVSHAAGLDSLTQLPRRGWMLDQLAHAIGQAKRHGTRLAVLYLDFDNFKRINDTLGHAAGDQVLKLVTSRLVTSIRETDLVSRYGGDEFLILLTDIATPADAALIAQKITATLDMPSRVGEHVLRLTASIGISLYPDDAEDADTLIARADAAMYRAKSQRVGSFEFYGSDAFAEGILQRPRLAALERPAMPITMTHEEQEKRHLQLREANEQLVLAVLDAHELREAAEQGQRRQSQFLAVVANELRDPLTPIRVATAMLGRVRTDEPLLPRAQSMIEHQLTQMNRLVDRLDDISKIQMNKLTLMRQMVDMTSIIDEAVNASRPAMDARLQGLKVRMPSRALVMHGDPNRLTQLLGNLLDNASKYTPDGGEIDLSVTTADDQIVLTVSDNGVGITALALPRIFEPFVQDTHTTGLNGVGMGIGLTVVRALVEAHGGHITAASAGSGLGSQFVVKLPLGGRSGVDQGGDGSSDLDSMH
ncbi:diguanylate cyclase domain-containing protein [Thiomonas sp. FB-Cd]|uniref:diguanylate cyclase domain-containing protein n=1 Tax=Thiomonas sp. FB-Cd TaxID=1158292 RepID=UPI000A7BD1B2|nr:diguanylate cyclase [Thiomonas sp. FB-Cd]